MVVVVVVVMVVVVMVMVKLFVTCERVQNVCPSFDLWSAASIGRLVCGDSGIMNYTDPYG